MANLEWTQAITQEAKKAPVIKLLWVLLNIWIGYKVCKLLIESLVESMGITVPVTLFTLTIVIMKMHECIQKLVILQLCPDGSSSSSWENTWRKISQKWLNLRMQMEYQWKLKLAQSVAAKKEDGIIWWRWIGSNRRYKSNGWNWNWLPCSRYWEHSPDHIQLTGRSSPWSLAKLSTRPMYCMVDIPWWPNQESSYQIGCGK